MEKVWKKYGKSVQNKAKAISAKLFGKLDKKGWKKYGKIWEKCAKQGKGNQCQTLKVKF